MSELNAFFTLLVVIFIAVASGLYGNNYLSAQLDIEAASNGLIQCPYKTGYGEQKELRWAKECK